MIPASTTHFTSLQMKSWSAFECFLDFVAIGLQSAVKSANNGGGSVFMLLKTAKLIRCLLPPYVIVRLSFCSRKSVPRLMSMQSQSRTWSLTFLYVSSPSFRATVQ